MSMKGTNADVSDTSLGWALFTTFDQVFLDPAAKLTGCDAMFTCQGWNGGTGRRGISDQRLFDLSVVIAAAIAAASGDMVLEQLEWLLFHGCPSS